MTNAEKLAKNTDKLANILHEYCMAHVCAEGCAFEQDCSKVTGGYIGSHWKEWLESEAKEDG